MSQVIVRGHNAGLGSLINNVLMHMMVSEVVGVDWRNTLYSQDEENLWDVLFDGPPSGKSPHNPMTVGVHEPQWLTYKNVAELYQSDGNWRRRCRAQWIRLCPRFEHVLEALEFTQKHFYANETVAVQVRVNGHAGEQINGKSQPLDEYARAIESTGMAHNGVFVVSSDEESLAWFEQRFPVISYPKTKRARTRASADVHLSVKQTPEDAIVAFEEIMVMSQAHTLIHGISNMSTLSLIISPTLKSVYLP